MSDLGPVLAELRNARDALSRATTALGTRRADLAPVLDFLRNQVSGVVLDLCLSTQKQDPYRRPKLCLFCGQKMPVTRGVGRPRKFCSEEHSQRWHEAQRRIERRAGR